MLENLIEADKVATLWINSFHCAASDAIWSTMSNKFIWFPFYLIIICLIFWRLGWKRGIAAVVVLALSILCVDQFANWIKDDIVCRLRPCNDPSVIERGLHIVEPANEHYCYGFFSAHAANSFAFAMASSMILAMDVKRKWRGYTIGVFIWAALVGISRVFVAKHFLGDVLVGTLVGCLFAFVITKVIFLIYNKLPFAQSAQDK